MQVELDPHQTKAVREMKNGCVLRGGVGSGKSRTALYYWFTRVCGGSIRVNGKGSTGPMSSGKDLYIITTAKKRESAEWMDELAAFGISESRENSFGYTQATVDSWNNILKYKDVKGAFFIFDEQRLVGSGAWVKAFLSIAKTNQWVILSATPGDIWLDYAPVFIANGFYKNRTEFISQHVVYSRFSKFPKVDRYVDTGRLERIRREILVDMPVHRHTKRHLRNIIVDHDRAKMEEVLKKRWHIYEERPIRDVAELFLVMRKLANSDKSRIEALRTLLEKHPCMIVFYNFNYELDLLRKLVSDQKITAAEWNGQKHESIPTGKSWLYIVQYTAGAEGWNCVTTDSMTFYSQNYSYKIFEQAQGRIDRMNTPYTDLYYYIFRSSAAIDTAITKALSTKKNFNEKAFASKMLF